MRLNAIARDQFARFLGWSARLAGDEHLGDGIDQKGNLGLPGWAAGTRTNFEPFETG